MNAEELLKQYNNGKRGFFDADLREANLSKANLMGADFEGANLEWADLSEADLERADLKRANLKRADLREADFREADLKVADLRGADLRGAILWEADFEGADLRGADLEGADLEGANLNRVQVDNNTSLTVESITKETKQVLLNKHVIWIHDMFIKIGCRCHPISDWLKNYEEIGMYHGYSASETKIYGKAIKKIKEVLGT